ncbi:Protein of unknown function [Propionibacterium freudenreichii]|uniref:Uncharacterized protein n=2 Tax=Propionibacterium freudenreichii TaxID=1744 RepID=D7GIX4_PROFC|nr:Hypothetical protein PFREUD_05150 [Propionibacterium freudenreichii subsp. shermanii CIRM-BIA1]CDP48008.1 Protein of unknown function [Propionibacterium freudenreichii subsp. freudenreichii]CEG85410.1 Protein of unknown function [Propionibacterium freudenreichii]CEG89585.1 Protein of unknown function [Propionibacterium freudenreichii]CEG92639.1 Protein of unknown function [Propionibacterium freudenreichii]
MTYFDGRIERK